MSITTTTILPAPIQQSFNMKLLSVPVPNMIHSTAAFQLRMPQNGGRILRSRRYNPLAVFKVPLGNSGVEPAPQVMTATDIDVQINFYGTSVILNEQVSLQNQDPVLNETVIRLGIALRQTEDELTRDMLNSTASFINCVGGANGDNPSEITRSDVDTAIRTLVNNNAYTISDMIEGEDRFGTAPVRDAFFAMCNSNMISDLEQVQGFTAKAQYPAQMNVLRSEWGSVSNLRFLTSSIGASIPVASGLGATVYPIFCAGMESYAAVEQDGYSAQFIYRPQIYSGPLALNASAGVKFAAGYNIMNDAWILALRATLAA